MVPITRSVRKGNCHNRRFFCLIVRSLDKYTVAPLDPFVVYLRCSKIRTLIEKAIPERGNGWLNAVIDYHCNGGYGKARGLRGFEGYISALEERQRREVAILESLNMQYLILDDLANDCEKTYAQLTNAIR